MPLGRNYGHYYHRKHPECPAGASAGLPAEKIHRQMERRLYRESHTGEQVDRWGIRSYLSISRDWSPDLRGNGPDHLRSTGEQEQRLDWRTYRNHWSEGNVSGNREPRLQLFSFSRRISGKISAIRYPQIVRSWMPMKLILSKSGATNCIVDESTYLHPDIPLTNPWMVWSYMPWNGEFIFIPSDELKSPCLHSWMNIASYWFIPIMQNYRKNNYQSNWTNHADYDHWHSWW